MWERTRSLELANGKATVLKSGDAWWNGIMKHEHSMTTTEEGDWTPNMCQSDISCSHQLDNLKSSKLLCGVGNPLVDAY